MFRSKAAVAQWWSPGLIGQFLFPKRQAGSTSCTKEPPAALTLHRSIHFRKLFILSYTLSNMAVLLETKTKKWGNSLGVIIPSEVVVREKLKENEKVEL